MLKAAVSFKLDNSAFSSILLSAALSHVPTDYKHVGGLGSNDMVSLLSRAIVCRYYDLEISFTLLIGGPIFHPQIDCISTTNFATIFISTC